jgi:hypothetical protein
VGGALAGIGITAFVAHRTGIAALGEAVGEAAFILPVCLLLELGKVGCEALATRAVLGPPGLRIPWGRLYQVHLVTGAVGQVFPAPRPAAEAVKATLLRPWIDLPEATSAGATLQAATFLSVALLSLAGALAIPASPAGLPLAALLYGNFVVLTLLGTALRALLRSRRATAWLSRRLPKRAAAIGRFHDAACIGHVVAVVPALWLALGMMCNVAELGLIARAIGLGTSAQGAFAAFGVQLIAATVAVFVPGQFGAREAAFGMAAEVLHTTEVRATAIALSAHAVQLGLAALGFLMLAILTGRASAARS